MANDSIRGRQVVLRLTNKSGGGLVEGDVVIVSSGTAAAVTTTTSAGLNTDVIGVALETIAADAIGRIAITGYVPKINLSGAASLGDTFATHSVAKQAAPSATRGSGSFGEVLGTGTTPAAVLWGLPDPSGAGGMASDALWDAAGDLAIGTGSNTGGRLAIGTAGQTLRVNAGATAPEWVSGGRVLISEQTPTGTGTVSWASIPATYKDLELEAVVRSTDGGVLIAIRIFLNNDKTATNYRFTQNSAYGVNSVGAEANDQAQAGYIPGGGTPAGSCGQLIANIIQYAGTTFKKQITTRCIGRMDDASTYRELISMNGIERENTEAVNRVDVDLAAGNYDTGSTLRLYGVY